MQNILISRNLINRSIFCNFRTIILSIICLVIMASASAVSSTAQTLYGISNGFGTAANNTIYQIDPATGAISNVFPVTLPGFAVTNSQALAYRPTSGILYAVIQASGRRLVTVDPATGIATNIGVLSQNISSLAFRADGTLIGVSGNGSAIPETLFSISLTDATLTQLFALGNGADGETIAFHPNGLLYHSSGNGTAEFESVDLTTMTVTPIGTATNEAFAMGYSPTSGQMFLSDINSNLFTVDITTGARTLVGNIPSANDNRGLAFVTAPTAASATISGRVSTPKGRGISNVIVTLTDTNGNSQIARSSAFGYFRFNNVEVGNTYIISVKSKRYRFSTQVINLVDNLTGLELIAQ